MRTRIPNAARTALALAMLVTVPLGGGCGRDVSPPASPHAREASVLADTALGAGLPPGRIDSIAPPPLTAMRIDPAGGEGRVPPPEAAPDAPPAPASSDRLPVDDRLRPPILRSTARLSLGAGAHGAVELDVHVDEDGAVDDVRWVSGDADSATVRAAMNAAARLRYYPAQRAGLPVAVWCRQRFDAGRIAGAP